MTLKAINDVLHLCLSDKQATTRLVKGNATGSMLSHMVPAQSALHAPVTQPPSGESA